MEATELNAVRRGETGKGQARRLRMAGRVPAVFYGPHAETTLLSVNAADLLKILKKQEENVLIRLIIDDGGKKLEKLSMVKEVQTEPVSRRFFHADFYEISMDHLFTFEIPIHFIGTPVGVENGGELHHGKREIKVSCLPTQLPDAIEIDISALRIGDHLKVSDLKAAEGMTYLEEGDILIASVAATKAARAAMEETASPAEPEAIGHKG